VEGIDPAKHRQGKTMVLKGFDLMSMATCDYPRPFVILCEDVITTGKTTRLTMDHIKERYPDVVFYSKVLALVNRKPGVKINGLGVISLYEYEARTWDPGNAPESLKHCRALRPKQNWTDLTTTYSGLDLGKEDGSEHLRSKPELGNG